MTRTYDVRKVSARFLRGIKCDICKIENTEYKCNDPRIRLEANAEVYGSGNSNVEVVFSVDFCPKCFRTKIIPFLQENGVDTDAARSGLLPEMW